MPSDLVNFRPDGRFAPGNQIAARTTASLLTRLKRIAATEFTEEDLRQVAFGLLNQAKQGDVAAYFAIMGKAAAESGICSADDGMSEEQKIAALRSIARTLLGINVEVTNAHSDPVTKP